MLAGIVIAIVLLAALGFGTRLYMSRAAEDRLRPGDEIGLAEFRGPVPQNGYLACPADYCAAAPSTVSPVFAVSADRLRELWADMLRSESGIVTVEAGPEHGRLVLVQHSALFRFPDVITVEFVALGPERSSLAIYSRARYGKLDFGVNRHRVETWMARLQRLAPTAPR